MVDISERSSILGVGGGKSECVEEVGGKRKVALNYGWN